MAASDAIKALLKKALPETLVGSIQRRRRRAAFQGLDRKNAFEKIYADGFWGRDAEGQPLSGQGSHESELIEPYIAEMRSFLSSLGKPSVIDLGCGDFNIGRQLCDLSKSYTACDISETILDINRKKFDIDNVEFRSFDLVRDELLPADICFVRQVLQHLSNADIKAFVDRINGQDMYKYLVITEHVSADEQATANIDKPTGPGVRVEQNSGVDLALEPFNLRFVESTKVLSIQHDSGGNRARIDTTVYRLV